MLAVIRERTSGIDDGVALHSAESVSAAKQRRPQQHRNHQLGRRNPYAVGHGDVLITRNSSRVNMWDDIARWPPASVIANRAMNRQGQTECACHVVELRGSSNTTRLAARTDQRPHSLQTKRRDPEGSLLDFHSPTGAKRLAGVSPKPRRVSPFNRPSTCRPGQLRRPQRRSPWPRRRPESR